ncbi:phosphatidylserine decarboxylase [Altererythrobacter confluentis]|uniref:Phosphatidylserine decarboxylase proenzyme n=1 Tax=Allopontixanthobacter confluentis TaxID=1849021 RepID=A0A6L7GH86_9SPHN|nr:archaetidylserine decarboxylase [Allopontixanthobacter confluentis]MXP15432.1 phosphatidylserine decarboxylase [Allopontixanthobacter confluentis]
MATGPFIWLQHIAPQHALSKLAGSLASSRTPWIKNRLIRQFISAYNVNMAEAAQGASDYASFNDFFTRALKPGARPIADPQHSIVSPADGAISQLGRIDNGRIVQAKGQSYSAAELLGGDEALAARFDGGAFMTIYLSPSDYHRVHMPVGGTLASTTYIPGALFSVNQQTAAGVPRLFARNERLSCVFDTDLGSVASVMVGAMIVASIETVWSGRVAAHGKHIIHTDFDAKSQRDSALSAEPAPMLAAGEEMGRFLLGSTVILLFEPGRIEWLAELAPTDKVRMGQAIARRL